MFLTHYSRVVGIARLGLELHAAVDAYVTLAHRHGADPAREARLGAALFEWHSAALDAHGYGGDLATRHALLDDDIALNVQGLISWLDRRG